MTIFSSYVSLPEGSFHVVDCTHEISDMSCTLNAPFDSVPGVLGFVTLNPGSSLSFPENGKRRFSPFFLSIPK